MTNDDSVDSPALPPLLSALRGLAPVRAVVPAREYSWSAKTLSRFARLRLVPAAHLGEGVFALDGSPADCANVGIHQVHPQPPALVVSGVNIGENAGVALLLSSGTVGAALEAALCGVPAAAFSLQLEQTVYDAWTRSRDPAPLAPIWERAAAVTRDIVAEILSGGLPGGARLLSVNIPQDAGPGTRRVLTGLADTTYGAFFRPDADGTLQHHYGGSRRTMASLFGASLFGASASPDAPATPVPDDIDVLRAGAVSITPLDLRLSAAPSAADRTRFERD